MIENSIGKTAPPKESSEGKTAPPLKKVSHEGELDAVKDLKKTVESGTNSYSSYNKKMISALKKD